MNRKKFLSYTTMITLLSPAIIGVHRVYAETGTSNNGYLGIFGFGLISLIAGFFMFKKDVKIKE